MANFWQVLKKVGNVALTFEPIAAAGVGIMNPALGQLMNTLTGTIHSAVVGAEATVQSAKSGQIKADAATEAFNGALATIQDILSAEGKQMTYDGNALKAALDATVASYNAIAALKQTMHIADAPKA